MNDRVRQGLNPENAEELFRDGDFQFKFFVLPAGLSFRPDLVLDTTSELGAVILIWLYVAVWGSFKLLLDRRYKVLLLRRPAESAGRPQFFAVYIANSRQAAFDRLDALAGDWDTRPDYTNADAPGLTSKQVRQLIRASRRHPTPDSDERLY